LQVIIQFCYASLLLTIRCKYLMRIHTIHNLHQQFRNCILITFGFHNTLRFAASPQENYNSKSQGHKSWDIMGIT